MKQYSESCEQNKKVILNVIKPLLKNKKRVLEVGSGSGQHAAYFAKNMPHLTWQASDREQYLPSINAWISEKNLSNTPKAFTLDVMKTWPNIKTDAVFSANTTHIMSLEMVASFFKGVGCVLNAQGLFILYGPFNYNNHYTSTSNAHFDTWLKQQNPDSAIRNFETLDSLANEANMSLLNDYEMPMNNRILCWQKQR